MTQLNQRQIPAAIAARVPFQGSSIRGEIVGYMPATGMLPDNEVAKLRDFIEKRGSAIYVVYSYGTPIAWSDRSGYADLYVPAVKYSVTTSKHQGLVRRAA